MLNLAKCNARQVASGQNAVGRVLGSCQNQKGPGRDSDFSRGSKGCTDET